MVIHYLFFPFQCKHVYESSEMKGQTADDEISSISASSGIGSLTTTVTKKSEESAESELISGNNQRTNMVLCQLVILHDINCKYNTY